MASRSLRARAASIALLVSIGCATGVPIRMREDGGDAPDAGPAPIDAATDDATTIDAFVPPPGDSGPDPMPDAFVPPPDARVVGTRGYLDRCTADGDCASGACADDVGTSRFCTRSCASDTSCAHEHVCVEGACARDDTGSPCSIGTPETCATGLCLGASGGGACTRHCASASQCPSGYACTRAGGSTMPICVDIERPCASAGECGSGLCIPTLGCTAECTTASDCPRRLAGLPGYTCQVAFGSTTPICVPPSDVVGDDPIGAPCVADVSGLYECRSAACDESAPLGPMCTQACTAEGGCGPGLGCFPLADGAMVTLVCERAGLGALGASCASARECASGLCDTAGYCTRLCADGLCPSDMSCMPVAGTGVALCRRP